MLKVLVACGCGMGSSQLLKKNCSTVVGENFVSHLKVKEGTIVIGLKNLMNKKELETKLKESGIV